jgi:hypothetical protein
MVYESVKLSGEISVTNNILKHYTYQNLYTYLKKINLYSKLRAKQSQKKHLYPFC